MHPSVAAEVDPDRLAILLDDLEAGRRAGTAIGDHLCRSCVEIVSVTGAGIMLMVDGAHSGTFGASDAVIDIVEELQFTLGEGPCVDACTSAVAVAEPDLAAPAVNRWPAFSGPAVQAGVRAVFGFPLLVGDLALGALDLYVDHSGGLAPDQTDDAIVLAGVISDALLRLQADAHPGALAPELEVGMRHRAVVHQATGMLSAQLGIDVRDALVRIRAHAYTENRPVNDVARDIVDRQLRL